MEPTLEDGQFLLVNKLVYLRLSPQDFANLIPFLDVERSEPLFTFHPPRRGEVIIFRFPRDPTRDFVKRVIAVPGDTLEVRDNALFVTGVKIENALVRASQEVNIPAKVPPDSYFVMGDNRRSSNDSRDWGVVPNDNIIGRGWVSYWPVNRFSVLRAFTLP